MTVGKVFAHVDRHLGATVGVGPKLRLPRGVKSDDWSYNRVVHRAWIDITKAQLKAGGTVEGTCSIVDARGKVTLRSPFVAEVCYTDYSS